MAILVQPSRMRSTVAEDGGSLRISIPQKRNWTTVLFFAIWLPLWTYGGWDIGHKLVRNFRLFEFLWMLFWVAAELTVFYVLLRMFFGQDTVLVNASTFNLRKEILGLAWTRAYLVPEVRNLRFAPESGAGRGRRASRIAFDYGATTIDFGEEIEEAEATQLINTIKSRCNIPASPAETATAVKFWHQG
jgi:hypothetical protein